jgi:hypothetical protein
MIRRVTLDQVLWFLFGSVMLISFKGNFLRHFLLNGSSDAPGFRVPFNVIANFEDRCHPPELLKDSTDAIDRQ